MSISIDGFNPENMERIHLGEPAVVEDGYKPVEDVLSDKEYRVASLAAEGLKDTEIAEETSRSTSTVKTHLHNARRILGVSSRVGLAGYFPLQPDDPKMEGKSLRQTSFRELEVVEGLSRGLANKRVAWLSGVSVSTVRTHVYNVSEKLDHNAVNVVRILNGLRSVYVHELLRRGQTMPELAERLILPNLAWDEPEIRKSLTH